MSTIATTPNPVHLGAPVPPPQAATNGPVPAMPVGQGVSAGSGLWSTIVRNVSGGPLKLSDLRNSREDEGFDFQEDEAVDLRNYFDVARIQASRDLRRALFPGEGKTPALVQLRTLDDPAGNVVEESAALRTRIEEEIRKPLIKTDTGRVSPGRGALSSLRVQGKDPLLDRDVQEVVNRSNEYDARLRERIEGEEAENEMAQQGDLID